VRSMAPPPVPNQTSACFILPEPANPANRANFAPNSLALGLPKILLVPILGQVRVSLRESPQSEQPLDDVALVVRAALFCRRPCFPGSCTSADLSVLRHLVGAGRWQPSHMIRPGLVPRRNGVEDHGRDGQMPVRHWSGCSRATGGDRWSPVRRPPESERERLNGGEIRRLYASSDDPLPRQTAAAQEGVSPLKQIS
jgi:hypothetical protein